MTDLCPDQQQYKIITGLFSSVQHPQSFLCCILCISPLSMISHSSCLSPKWVCASTWKNAQQIPLNIPGKTCKLRPQLPTKEEPVSDQSLICHPFCLWATPSVLVILLGFHCISFLHPDVLCFCSCLFSSQHHFRHKDSSHIPDCLVALEQVLTLIEHLC